MDTGFRATLNYPRTASHDKLGDKKVLLLRHLQSFLYDILCICERIFYNFLNLFDTKHCMQLKENVKRNVHFEVLSEDSIKIRVASSFGSHQRAAGSTCSNGAVFIA